MGGQAVALFQRQGEGAQLTATAYPLDDPRHAPGMAPRVGDEGGQGLKAVYQRYRGGIMGVSPGGAARLQRLERLRVIARGRQEAEGCARRGAARAGLMRRGWLQRRKVQRDGEQQDKLAVEPAEQAQTHTDEARHAPGNARRTKVQPGPRRRLVKGVSKSGKPATQETVHLGHGRGG